MPITERHWARREALLRGLESAEVEARGLGALPATERTVAAGSLADRVDELARSMRPFHRIQVDHKLGADYLGYVEGAINDSARLLRGEPALGFHPLAGSRSSPADLLGVARRGLLPGLDAGRVEQFAVDGAEAINRTDALSLVRRRSGVLISVGVTAALAAPFLIAAFAGRGDSGR